MPTTQNVENGILNYLYGEPLQHQRAHLRNPVGTGNLCRARADLNGKSMAARIEQEGARSRRPRESPLVGLRCARWTLGYPRNLLREQYSWLITKRQWYIAA